MVDYFWQTLGAFIECVEIVAPSGKQILVHWELTFQHSFIICSGLDAKYFYVSLSINVWSLWMAAASPSFLLMTALDYPEDSSARKGVNKATIEQAARADCGRPAQRVGS